MGRKTTNGATCSPLTPPNKLMLMLNKLLVAAAADAE
jgi:hypothetical protein